MQKNIAELKGECAIRGIELDFGLSYSKKDLIALLAKQSLFGVTPGWGHQKRLDLESPMLCFAFKNLREDQKEDVLTSNMWIAEEKFNGCRMTMTYSPEEGLRFFGREISVDDYLPIEYTENILLYYDGRFMTPKKVPLLPYAFMIDHEIIVEKSITIPQNDFFIESKLNAVVAILSSNQATSYNIQEDQTPLQFRAFDLMWVEEENWMEKPLLLRKRELNEVVELLKDFMPIISSRMVTKDKLGFFYELLEKGGEGVVLKNLSAPYVGTTSRRRDIQVKLKRGMSGDFSTHSEDIDAFIIGHTKATKGKAWEDYVGGLTFGIYLKHADEQEYIHSIATITNLTLDFRKQLTEYVDGEPTLKSEWAYKVFTINGQSITARNKKIAHATIVEQRPDKTHLDCIIDESVLDEQTI